MTTDEELIRELERENAGLRKLLQKATHRAESHRGLPCCCEFDENDVVIIECRLHRRQREWAEEMKLILTRYGLALTNWGDVWPGKKEG